MCGRFTLTVVDPQRIAQRFAVSAPFEAAEALGRFNVCPTEAVLAVRGPEPRRAAVLRWGLVPRWARALRAGPELINARAETAGTRAPFAALLGRADRRCLVIADGWYEWLRAERPRAPRVPFRYTVDDGGPFAFAGLWDRTRIEDEPVASVTVLTAAANGVCARVHDRMPCVLEGPETEAAWLDPGVDAETAAALLAPLADDRVSVAAANPLVNKAGVEGAELLEPPEPEAAGTLF